MENGGTHRVCVATQVDGVDILCRGGLRGRKKELLVVIASMHHFTGDDSSALQELKTAKTLKFHDAKVDE